MLSDVYLLCVYSHTGQFIWDGRLKLFQMFDSCSGGSSPGQADRVRDREIDNKATVRPADQRFSGWECVRHLCGDIAVVCFLGTIIMKLCHTYY